MGKEKQQPRTDVFIQGFPDRYVGPNVTVTIHVRRKDMDSKMVDALKKHIEADLRVMNLKEFIEI